MSVEEEVELRDLVAQTLDLNGCLSKVRAQLRANLFLALDEDAKISKQEPLLNKKIKSYLAKPDGVVMFGLVREFLEFFDLDFTISVFEPESYLGNSYKYEGREKIIEDLGLQNCGKTTGPLLFELVKIAQTKSKTLQINLSNLNGNKTNDNETDDSISNSTQDDINGSINRNGQENKLPLETAKENINSTFNVKSPMIINNNNQLKNSIKENGTNVLAAQKSHDQNSSIKETENDDTFNGTSSIEEDINSTNDKSMNDDSKSSSNRDSPESKSKDEKTKSQRNEKMKVKDSLNKPRVSDILPSLYNKDFKDKSNREFDDFDIKDDYEEDFMSGSEVEFSLSKVDCPKPLLEELQQYDRSNSEVNSFTSVSSKNKISRQKNGKGSHSCSLSDDVQTSLSAQSEIGNCSFNNHHS